MKGSAFHASLFRLIAIQLSQKGLPGDRQSIAAMKRIKVFILGVLKTSDKAAFMNIDEHPRPSGYGLAKFVGKGVDSIGYG